MSDPLVRRLSAEIKAVGPRRDMRKLWLVEIARSAYVFAETEEEAVDILSADRYNAEGETEVMVRRWWEVRRLGDWDDTDLVYHGQRGRDISLASAMAADPKPDGGA
ncbi:MAG TPA: hypothetical protein PLS95_10045 [Thermoanaerobaculales bacterium]|nr:hypothetical protein [Thermoanaerobaculales bacterium]